MGVAHVPETQYAVADQVDAMTAVHVLPGQSPSPVQGLPTLLPPQQMRRPLRALHVVSSTAGAPAQVLPPGLAHAAAGA